MDRCGNCRYFADNGVHLFNCLWGIVGGRLDRADLFGDSNDFVCSRQHVLVIDIDDRTQRTNAVKSVDPFLESVSIGLNLLLERLLQGRGASDAYLADWKRSEGRPCGEDLQAEAAAEAARIEARFTDEDLETLIRAKGLATGS